MNSYSSQINFLQTQITYHRELLDMNQLGKSPIIKISKMTVVNYYLKYLNTKTMKSQVTFKDHFVFSRS